MSGVSNLGKALTVVFIFSLLALLSELLYVLWRRRRLLLFRPCRDAPQTAVDHHPGMSASAPYPSKKDLLCFFCLKTQSRVEPDGAAPTRDSDRSSVDDEIEVIDLFKLRQMYGPSRVLFTIKEEEEEERDDLESEKCISKSRNLSQSFGNNGTSPELVVAIEDCIEETPFSTPCASPLYFTPSASPVSQITGRGVCAVIGTTS